MLYVIIGTVNDYELVFPDYEFIIIWNIKSFLINLGITKFK